jgi:N-acetylglucosamine-6-phosphate deacetylase
MSQLFLQNAGVMLEGGIEHGGVLVRDGRIAHVFAGGERPTGLSSQETIDVKGAYLAPGLIDIHIHGSIGIDVQATDADGLDRLSEFLLSEGVTGYFATFVPTDEQAYRAALANIGSYQKEQEHANHSSQYVRGARILGVHFEGPFVSEHRCGALQREHFRSYDGDPRSIELFTGSPGGAQSTINRLMTLAPEVEGGLDLARALAQNGVRVFIGHSQAEPVTLDLAVEAGARHITHFPNALDPLHHRKPGAVGWGLVRDDVTMDCICDFNHVHPLMLRLMYHSKGPDRMALISDAIMPAGLGDGEFSVWGDKIIVRNGRTALARGHADTIAGSVITMRQALKNIADTGVPLHEAVHMASRVPARAAGIESEFGSIREGKIADLIVIDDKWKVRNAVIGGVRVDYFS